MERYKFLYELSRKALDEELDRYKKLDEKASRFLSILSIVIVAYTTLINAASSKISPVSTTGPAGWLFMGLTVITFIALFSSWFRIFNSIRLAESPRVDIGEHANLLAAHEDVLTMYNSLALSCQEAVAHARKNLEKKTDSLRSAYKEIEFSTYSLFASVMTYFWLASTTAGKAI